VRESGVGPSVQDADHGDDRAQDHHDLEPTGRGIGGRT